MSDNELPGGADDRAPPSQSATPTPIRAMRVIALSRESRPLAQPASAEGEGRGVESTHMSSASVPGEQAGPAETPLPTFEDRPTPDWNEVRTQFEAGLAASPAPTELEIDFDPAVGQLTAPPDAPVAPWQPAAQPALPTFADDVPEELTPVFLAREAQAREAQAQEAQAREAQQAQEAQRLARIPPQSVPPMPLDPRALEPKLASLAPTSRRSDAPPGGVPASFEPRSDLSRRAPSPPPPQFPSEPRQLAPEVRPTQPDRGSAVIEEIHAEEVAEAADTPAPVDPVAAIAWAQPRGDEETEHELLEVEPSPISAPPVEAFIPPRSESPRAAAPQRAEAQRPPEDSKGALPAAADRPPPPKRGSGRPALPTAKVRKKPWWEEVFGDDFSRTYRPPTQTQLTREADFIVESLGVPEGGVILDLACGQGEYAVELGRRGFSVVGYDLSVYQLAMAADRAQSVGQRINFLQGDMREMAFDSMFDAVLLWNTSFGYFEEDRNFDVLCRIRNALRPGGVLLLEIMNRDYAAREAPISNWYEGDGCICMDDMALDFITSRLNVKRSVILDDGRSKEVTYSVRLYCLSEIGKMLHDAGFTVQSVSGSVSTPHAFLGGNSPSLIIRAERPAAG